MNKKGRSLQSYLFFLCVAVIFSCKQDKRPDISNIDLAIKIERFDQDLYQAKNSAVKQTDLALSKKYGSFYADYIQKMVGTPEIT